MLVNVTSIIVVCSYGENLFDLVSLHPCAFLLPSDPLLAAHKWGQPARLLCSVVFPQGCSCERPDS